MSARAGEQMVIANGVDLCTRTFGDAGDPAVLLAHGACASMLRWEEALCHAIAAGGRHVIRFDNREVGSAEPERIQISTTPGGSDLPPCLGTSPRPGRCRAHPRHRVGAGWTTTSQRCHTP